MMSLRTPLGRVLGLGSAKDGTSHWWIQRMTAVALIPLSGWFLVSLVALGSSDHATIVEWLAAPYNTVVMILLLISLFYHSKLGIQVVVEDYISGWLRLATIMFSNALHFLFATAGIFAVLRLAFGADP